MRSSSLREDYHELKLLPAVRTLVRVSSIVVRNPEILGGTPVFAGTRVPVKNLTDYLEGGSNIDEFLDDFPSVKREQVIAFLETN